MQQNPEQLFVAQVLMKKQIVVLRKIEKQRIYCKKHIFLFIFLRFIFF